MDGYELAALLRNKVTITNAMLAADKLIELEDRLKKADWKYEPPKYKIVEVEEDESKPSSNKSKSGSSKQRKATNNNRSEGDSSRPQSEPNLYEPLLSDAREMVNARSD